MMYKENKQIEQSIIEKVDFKVKDNEEFFYVALKMWDKGYFENVILPLELREIKFIASHLLKGEFHPQDTLLELDFKVLLDYPIDTSLTIFTEEEIRYIFESFKMYSVDMYFEPCGEEEQEFFNMFFQLGYDVCLGDTDEEIKQTFHDNKKPIKQFVNKETGEMIESDNYINMFKLSVCRKNRVKVEFHNSIINPEVFGNEEYYEIVGEQ